MPPDSAPPASPDPVPDDPSFDRMAALRPPGLSFAERVAAARLALLDRLAGAARPWLRYLAGGTAVLVVVIVGWRLLDRGKAVPVDAQLPRASGPAAGASGGSPAPTAASPPAVDGAPIVVHVAGAVVQPGLHDLAAGARVADAVAAAGGAAADADLDRLNLAAPLADGRRIYVLRRGEATEPAVVGGGGAASGPGGVAAPGPIDLNSATAEQLDTLPGIGPATAQAIIAYRQQHGRFRSVDELLEVRGIGDARMEQLRPLVVVR